MLEFVVERECVVIVDPLAVSIIILEKFVWMQIGCEFSRVRALTLDLVLEVLYVVAVTQPVILKITWVKADRFSILQKEFLLWKNYRFHSLLIKRVRFRQVQNVERNLSRLITWIDNLEEKPLSVTFSIQIIL